VLLAIVLFPVISATDDLNSLMMAAEDGFRKSKAVHAALTLAAIPIFALLFLALSLFASRSTLGRVIEERLALPLEVALAAAAGRAPPTLTF